MSFQTPITIRDALNRIHRDLGDGRLASRFCTSSGSQQ